MNEQLSAHRIEYRLILLSAVLIGFAYYGIRSAAVYGLAVVTAVSTDLLCLFLRGRTYQKCDLQNVDAAVVMAMMFPATIPFSIVLLSTVFSTAIGAHVFGSRERRLFPQAAVGYLFAYLCWKNELSMYPDPGQKLSLFGNRPVLHQSLAETLYTGGVLRTEKLDLLIGNISGPMGTGCFLLLAAGCVILIFRRQLSPWALFGYLAGTFAGSAAVNIHPTTFLLVGMTLFSSMFLFSDNTHIPCKSFFAAPVSILAGGMTVYLAVVHGLVQAPVIVSVIISPFWYLAAAAEKKYLAIGTSDEMEVQNDAESSD